MNITQALQHAQNGRLVTRTSWEQNTYLVHQHASYIKCFKYVDADGNATYWNPKQSDLTATDYSVVY